MKVHVKRTFKSYSFQKQPSRGVLRKRSTENMQQIYRRTSCRSAISIKLQSNFIEITLWHGCSPVNLLHFFRTHFLKNTSEGLLLSCLVTKIKEIISKNTSSAWNILLPSVQVCRMCLYSLFQNQHPLILLPPLFRNISIPR